MKQEFSFYNPPVREVKYVKEADLYGIYRYITDPKYARLQTETLRAIQNEEEKKRYKANHFAYCLFSGTFGVNRKNDGLVEHSGLMCFDFDHVNDNDNHNDNHNQNDNDNDNQNQNGVQQGSQTTGSDKQGALQQGQQTTHGVRPPCAIPFGAHSGSDPMRSLLSDPNFETLLLFRSPSGDGIKWVIEVDLQKATHEQWYIGVSNYLKQTYGLEADPACKNVARACFLPYDPNCYLAPRLHRELVRVLESENYTQGQTPRAIPSGALRGQTPMCSSNVMDLMNRLCATQIKIESYE